MIDSDRGQPVEVHVGGCLCPGAPHASGDVVWLRSKPDLAMGFATRRAIQDSPNTRPDLEAALMPVFLHYGIASWNLVDAKGDAVRVSPAAIDELIGWTERGLLVADRAADLYTDAVLSPLLPAKSSSPSATPSNGSTSQSPPSGPKRRTSQPPSSRSSAADGTTSGATGALP